jgi:AcrR family transcriptional regulator
LAYRKTVHTEARKAANRRRLLEVARKLVAEGGFQEVQIATVAAVAGVATGTVYRYFPSKADLCAEVFRTVCDREIEVARGVAAAEGEPVERLADLVEVFAGRALRGRKLAYALIAEPVGRVVDAERLVYRRALGQVFEGIVLQGIEAGELPPQDAETAAACIVGAVMESLVSPLAPGAGSGDDKPAELLAAVGQFCLRAVGAAP